MKYILAIFYMITLPMILLSNDHTLTILNEKYTYPPGVVTSIPITLVNNQNSDIGYEIAMTSLSDKVEIYLLNKNITVKGLSKETYLLPINIKKDCPSGIHEVILKVLQKETTSFQIFHIKINVTANNNMIINSLKENDFVKAGDTIYSRFSVKNLGNIKQTIELSSVNGLILGKNQLTLLPLEERIIIISRSTNKKEKQSYLQLMDLTIKKLSDPSKSIIMATQYTNVIAVHYDKMDMYKRWPIMLHVNYINMNQNNVKGSGFQGQLFTQGSLTDDDDNIIEIRMTTKSPIRYSNLQNYEEYYGSFVNKNIAIHIGDKAFSSSYLTELHRYGRGIEFQLKKENYTVGAFYNKPRFFNEIKDEFNVYTKYLLNEKNNIKFGYLQKHNLIDSINQVKIDNLPFIVYETELIKNTKVMAEYALSFRDKEIGSAYALNTITQYKRINTSFNLTFTDPNFVGYYRNTRNFNASINYRLSSKINLSANHTQNINSYERDTILLSEPIRKNSQLNANYFYSKKGSFGITGGYTSSKDRLALNLFDYEELFTRANLNQRIHAFNINIYSHVGRTKNNIIKQNGLFLLNSINLFYNKKTTSLQLFANFTNDSRYTNNIDETKLNLYYGGSISKNIYRKTSINLYYQNNYIPEEYFRDRNQFEGVIKHMFNKNHALELSARYMIQRGTVGYKDFIVQFKYIAQLNIPYKKIKDLTSLQGQILKKDNSKVEGIRVYLGDRIAITDKNGNYTFNNITTGSHYFNIDKAGMPLNTIANLPTPTLLELKDSKVNYQNVELTQASQLFGKVILHEDASFNIFNDKKQIENSSVIIEVNDGNQTLRKICNLNKTFDFNYLKPGLWKIKIYPNELSKNLKIVASDFEIVLEANQKKQLDIDIKTVHKEIFFQEQKVKVGILNK